jgi:two-component system response regulator DesR
MIKVIVADDNFDAAETLAALLEAELSDSVEVEVVHDGDRALEAAFASPPPQLVALLDIDMPGRTGLEVAAEIRRSSTGAEMAALVAMSGDDGLVTRAEASGLFELVVRKPIDLGRLMRFCKRATRPR